jgi:diacylglycerol kinase (ATP)
MDLPLKNRPFSERLGFALAGWGAGWRRERSFRTQVVAGGLVLLVLLVLRPPPVWWALVILVVAMVLALELFNAALETLIDHLHPDRHPEVKIVKDMAAGSVLLVCLGAVVLAICMMISLL